MHRRCLDKRGGGLARCGEGTDHHLDCVEADKRWTPGNGMETARGDGRGCSRGLAAPQHAFTAEAAAGVEVAV